MLLILDGRNETKEEIFTPGKGREPMLTAPRERRVDFEWRDEGGEKRQASKGNAHSTEGRTRRTRAWRKGLGADFQGTKEKESCSHKKRKSLRQEA